MILFVGNNSGILFIKRGILATIRREVVRMAATISRKIRGEARLWK